MAENDAGAAAGAAAEEWVALGEPANETEAAIVVGFLQAEEIPARVDDRSFHQTPTTDNEDLKEIFVLVPKSREAEARAILAAREAAFRNQPEGAETVLTDDGMAELDPNAGTEEGQK